MKEWLKAESPEDVGKFYDAKYSENGIDALSRGKWQDIVDMLIVNGGQFDRNKRLLEAGCGHGQFLEEVCENLDCVGIDVSAEAIKLAKNRLGEDAELTNMPMENLSGQFGLFNYVVSFGAIEHTMAPNLCFNNLMNSLVVGGILLITVPLDFTDCFQYIKNEKNQKTNERFATISGWLDYFGNKHESWSVIGEGDMKDLAIIVRKEI